MVGDLWRMYVLARIPWVVQWNDGRLHAWHGTSVEDCDGKHQGWAYRAGWKAGLIAQARDGWVR